MNQVHIKAAQKITANGATFFVEQSGGTASGKDDLTLVFLHYFGGSSRSWREVMPLLPSACRRLAPDLRGFGDSDATPGGYSVAENADDVLALLQVLEVRDFVLIGHSMGGKIALEVASRQPKYLRSLVLLAPSPPTPEPIPDAERARMRAGWGHLDSAWETIRGASAPPLEPEVFERAVADGLRSSRAAWLAWLDSGSREDISARMSRIQVPISVLAGECDGALGPQVLLRELVARVVDSRLSVAPGCGHLLPLEAPQVVADFIRQCVES